MAVAKAPNGIDYVLDEAGTARLRKAEELDPKQRAQPRTNGGKREAEMNRALVNHAFA